MTVVLSAADRLNNKNKRTLSLVVHCQCSEKRFALLLSLNPSGVAELRIDFPSRA